MKSRVLFCVLLGGVLSAITSPAVNAQSTLIGDGLTQTTDFTGTQVNSLFSFMFNVSDVGGGLSQHLSTSSLLSSTTGTVTALNEISSTATNVQCLQVSSNGKTAWWSGTVFFQTPDARVNAAVNEQILNDVSAGRYIVGGKIINGKVEARSLFISGATFSEVSLNDAGTIGSVSPSILGATGASYCGLGDGLFQAADYVQLNSIHTGPASTSHRCVTGRAPRPNEVLCDIEWLDANGNPSGIIVANTPANLAQPPQFSLYDLSGVVRQFVAGKVAIVR
jgi:hypothetical protein